MIDRINTVIKIVVNIAEKIISQQGFFFLYLIKKNKKFVIIIKNLQKLAGNLYV